MENRSIGKQAKENHMSRKPQAKETSLSIKLIFDPNNVTFCPKGHHQLD